MFCTRCKKLIGNTDTKTCGNCIAYIDKSLVCEKCNSTYTRTNRERHYRSYRCRVIIYYEL